MDGSSSSSESDSDAPPEMASSHAHDEPPPKRGRANKNQPAQASSKMRVSTFRIAPGLTAKGGTVQTRDPRYDEGTSGHVDEAAWRKNYGFLFDQQRDEIERMKERLAVSNAASHRAKQRGGGAKRRRTREKVLSPEDEAALKHELERAQNRAAQEERRAKQQAIKSEMRKEEVDAVRQGKKPYFPKKSEIRERELVAKYEELRKEGKLEKFLAKRRQKNASKQRRALPYASGAPDVDL
jgi:ribosomal RNA-processing protein 36